MKLILGIVRVRIEEKIVWEVIMETISWGKFLI